MGLVEGIKGKRVYLDTNIWIYAVEAYPSHVNLLTQLFTKIDQGELLAVTSKLTIAEVLVKPIKDGNQSVAQAYQKILQPSANFELIAISRQILETAAQVRAQTKLKLPDAIHLATALTRKVETFVTNDVGFVSMQGIKILQLSEFL